MASSHWGSWWSGEKGGKGAGVLYMLSPTLFLDSVDHANMNMAYSK